ncbi:hypothetical protein [Parabacteroides goldsteinii]
MIETCYIDNIDIYSAYGIRIISGGLDGILAFPDLRDPEQNDWPEMDGIEVDLETPTLKEKSVTISFVAARPDIDISMFLDFITQLGYKIFVIPDLQRNWALRYEKHPGNITYDSASYFTITFVDDFPARSDYYPVPVGGGISIPASPFMLDGIRLERYGVVVKEAHDEIIKTPTTKKNLTRSSSYRDGQVYDAETLYLNSKEVTLKCCLIASSVERFWECYDAFFNDLIKPGERSLHYDRTLSEFPCYYKKTSGWKIGQLTGPVVVEFSLTLVFTRFRLGKIEYVLADETGAFIVTEDGFLIDMML